MAVAHPVVLHVPDDHRGQAQQGAGRQGQQHPARRARGQEPGPAQEQHGDERHGHDGQHHVLGQAAQGHGQGQGGQEPDAGRLAQGRVQQEQGRGPADQERVVRGHEHARDHEEQHAVGRHQGGQAQARPAEAPGQAQVQGRLHRAASRHGGQAHREVRGAEQGRGQPDEEGDEGRLGEIGELQGARPVPVLGLVLHQLHLARADEPQPGQGGGQDEQPGPPARGAAPDQAVSFGHCLSVALRRPFSAAFAA